MTRPTARSVIRNSGAFLLLGSVLLLLSGVALAADDPTAAECLACHGDRQLKRGAPAPGRSLSLFVDEAAVKASVHASVECVACHKNATAPHDERLPAVACAECHAKARAALSEGVHGSAKARARAPAPTCAGCHGTHAVGPVATLGIESCATCHARQVGLYRESIHARSRQRGDSQAATCRSCHGDAHALLAKTDARAPTYHLNLPRTCAQCHADPELAKRYNIPVGNVYQLYMDSIHGRALTRSGLLVAANCSDCHGAHEINPRAEPASRVFRANVPKTCGACHAGILAAYAESVHGTRVARGDLKAPVCTDCHSAHQIRRVEGAPWQLEAIRECGTCHEESLKTYRDTFHGKVTALGYTRVAKCSDCHGAHDVLPLADPRSSVSPARIVATCRQCHPQATAAFAEFHPHADYRNKARFPKLYYTYLVMTGLLVAVLTSFGLHAILWLPRSLVDRLRR
ncbi:MAG: cytochrome c3 family protein [Candidatus Rokubacteria bacterium]|nr:cytochrome c3 family protein [Candidatus Rokubacteria bacterium]